MDRVIIPKLTTLDLGSGKLGWYMDELQTDAVPEVRYPIFQSPCCNERRSLKLHSIEPDGEVNASILCSCSAYHVFGILENWPPQFKKRAGELTIENN